MDNQIRKFINNVYCKKCIVPFSLEKMAKNTLYILTAEQESIFRKASGHCMYAAPGDYPWGSIIDENGNEKVVCKCENRKCFMFEDCRADLFYK